MSTSCHSVTCPYCGKPAQMVKGSKVYPHRPDLAKLNFWECEPCGAFVGTHAPGARVELPNGKRVESNGTLPMGRLANKALRTAKRRAHDAFDPIWTGRLMGRREAYRWLSIQLELSFNECHIGYFDEAMCERVVQVCNQFRHSNGQLAAA